MFYNESYISVTHGDEIQRSLQNFVKKYEDYCEILFGGFIH